MQHRHWRNFSYFNILRHICECGEVKWKGKWSTAIFQKAVPFCLNFECIPYALACCFSSVLRYYLLACLTKTNPLCRIVIFNLEDKYKSNF